MFQPQSTGLDEQDILLQRNAASRLGFALLAAGIAEVAVLIASIGFAATNPANYLQEFLLSAAVLQILCIAAGIQLFRFLTPRYETLHFDLRANKQLFLSTINAMSEGLMVHNSSGAVEICNPAAAKILGASVKQMTGSAADEFQWKYIDDSMSDLSTSDLPALLTLKDGNPRYGVVLGVYRAEQDLRWIEVNSVPVFQADPRSSTTNPSHAITTFTDITERRIELQELTRLAAIIEHSTDAVIATTLDGTIVSWNTGAEMIYGYTSAEMIGQNKGQLSNYRDQEFFAAVVKTVLCGDRREGIEVVRRRKDGLDIEISLSCSPIRDSGGTVIGIGWIGQDITGRRVSEERIRLSEARLAEAQEVAKLGIYELDLVTNKITCSHEAARLYEIDLFDGEFSYDVILSRYAREERETRDRLFEKSVETGELLELDIRLALPSGTQRHIQLRAKPVKDRSGKTVRLVGTVMDITERVVSEERFRILFECSSEPHLLVGDKGIIDCNPAMLAMLRCDSKEQLRGLHPSVLSPEFQPDGSNSAEKGQKLDAYARKNGSHKFDWTHTRLNGEEFYVEVSLTLVTLHDQTALLSSWHDLTERFEAQKKIESFNLALQAQMRELSMSNERLGALSITDGLTGLPNHRKFQERLAEEFRRAKRYHKNLSLLFIDVDNFKEFNDSFGHPAGDIVLRKVAKIMRQAARTADLPARYGGEEFTIILPETDSIGAQRLAERLRVEVEDTKWTHRQVSVSIGISSMKPAMTDQTDLLLEADGALYEAKHAGKNRIASV